MPRNLCLVIVSQDLSQNLCEKSESTLGFLEGAAGTRALESGEPGVERVARDGLSSRRVFRKCYDISVKSPAEILKHFERGVGEAVAQRSTECVGYRLELRAVPTERQLNGFLDRPCLEFSVH